MSDFNKWIFLSYPLSSSISGYGNGTRIKVKQVRSISTGDSSINSIFSMPLHFGTHIDFPLHYSAKGKSVDEYSASDFIYKHIAVVDIKDNSIGPNYLITIDHIEEQIKNLPSNTEVLILKTGLCYKRDKAEYWEYGYGVGLGVAGFLKKYFINLKAFGVDLISINSYQQREIGRIAHREFLIDNDIVIIEDMNLTMFDSNFKIKSMIASPIIISKTEAAPVTIFAKIS